MERNEFETNNDISMADVKMIEVLERIAKDLERVLIGIFSCAGLLAIIAFVVTVRLLSGR